MTLLPERNIDLPRSVEAHIVGEGRASGMRLTGREWLTLQVPQPPVSLGPLGQEGKVSGLHSKHQ